MATTHFPTQVVLKEYSDNATLNITEANREADVYWIVLKNDLNFRVTVNLYKPCLIEIYYDEQHYNQTTYLLKLNEVKYANSFSIDTYRNDEGSLSCQWAKVYL